MFKIDMDSVREQIQDHLLDYLADQGVEIKSNGGQYFCCINPDHEDKNPSAHIIPNTKNREFKCFACNVHGDIFTAAHYLEGKPIGSDPDFYQDTVLYLAEKYGIEIDTSQMTEEEIFYFKARRAYQFASRYLIESEPNEMFLDKIKERDWDLDRVRRLGIGQISDYDKYKKYMIDNGFDADFLEKIDLVGYNAEWMFRPDRMVFTLFDHKHRPVGFAARNLVYEQEKNENKQTVKYKNTRSTGLYEKSKYLYGIDGAAEYPDRIVYIFEGQADVVTYRLKTGQANCVALGGLAFTDHHVEVLKDLMINNICLCLDGDDRGRERTANIVEKTGGNPGLSVSVLTLPATPDEKDIDAFLRKHGIDGWAEARKNTKSAFRWQLEHKNADQPLEQFIEIQVKNILNEQVPLRRWEMIKELAKATDTPEHIINEQVKFHEDQASVEYTRKFQALTQRTTERLQRVNPMDAKSVLARYEQDLDTLEKEYKNDIMSAEYQIDMLRSQREHELKNSATDGISFGWNKLDSVTNGGIPPEDTIIFVGGKSNVGKTSLMANLAWRALQNNEETIAICYTIDDSASKFIPRMVACETGIPTSWVTKPNGMYADRGDSVPKHLLPAGYNSRQEVIEATNNTYKKLEWYIKNNRLKIVDAPMSGASWSYMDKVIQKTRMDNPDAKIIIFLDNFHDLRDFQGSGDSREKYTELALLIRKTTARDRVTVFATIEYTKLPDMVKPSNSNLAESRKMEYVSDAIIHLVNSQHEFRTKPEACQVKWRDTRYSEERPDENGILQKYHPVKPIIEMAFGKSKISSFKGSIFLQFDPDACRFEELNERGQYECEILDRKQPWLSRR